MNLKGSPRRGLFGATLGFFVGFAAVALVGPTVDRFRELMDLSRALVGFLVAIPSLSGSLLRIPFAARVDRLLRAVAAATVCVSSAGWTTDAAAQQFANSDGRRAVPQSQASPTPASETERTNRDRSAALGSDYLMGRYILPLIIGIAAALGLILSLVLQSDDGPESDSANNSGPSSEPLS